MSSQIRYRRDERPDPADDNYVLVHRKRYEALTAAIGEIIGDEARTPGMGGDGAVTRATEFLRDLKRRQAADAPDDGAVAIHPSLYESLRMALRRAGVEAGQDVVTPAVEFLNEFAKDRAGLRAAMREVGVHTNRWDRVLPVAADVFHDLAGGRLRGHLYRWFLPRSAEDRGAELDERAVEASVEEFSGFLFADGQIDELWNVLRKSGLPLDVDDQDDTAGSLISHARRIVDTLVGYRMAAEESLRKAAEL